MSHAYKLNNETFNTPAKKSLKLVDTRANTSLDVQTTLGDLIAAAFDTVGDEVHEVAKLLASNQVRRSANRRILVFK